MPDIYSVNAKNIVGGPGRLIFKPFDGTYPETIADVMSLVKPHDLLNGWQDLGSTQDGITISRSFETEDFTVDQVVGAIDQDITEWSHTLATNLAENSVENRQLALVGSHIIETPPVLGTETSTTSALTVGATIVNVTSTADFNEGGYVSISGKTYRISQITGTALYLSEPLADTLTLGDPVSPIIELGTRRIGYGTVDDIPYHTFALISRRKDDTLYMAVFRRCKVSGDDKEQTFGNEKRLLPLGLIAYPDGDVAQEENVYYEIEQMR